MELGAVVIFSISLAAMALNVLVFNRATLVVGGFASLPMLLLASHAITSSPANRAIPLFAAWVGVTSCFLWIYGVCRRFEAEPSPVLPPETSLLDRPGFMPKGFVHGIEILNDHTTTMGFVIDVLQKHLGLGPLEAERLMVAIHNNGGAVVPLPTEEEARRTAAAIMAQAEQEQQPLVCRAISAEATVTRGTRELD